MNAASTTPIAMAAIALSTTEATMAAVPLRKSQGTSGMNAPRAKVKKEDKRRLHGRAQMLGADAQLLPGVGLESQLRIRHDLVHHVPRHFGIDAPLLVHAPQLEGLALGALAQRDALDFELALHELALCRHGEILPDSHGERTGHQTGHADQPYDLAPRAGSGHAQHERDVGDQPVAQSEHRRPGAPTADIAVAVGWGDRVARLGIDLAPRPA